MKLRHGVLVCGAVAAGWLAFFGDKTPSGSVVEPAVHASAGTAKQTSSPVSAPISRTSKLMRETEILVLRPREELIGGMHAGSNALFTSQNWTPPPPPAPPPPAPAPEKPTAPPLPFTYLGKKIEDGIWEAYLGRGEQTYIVREASVIDGLYRVDAVKPPTLVLTYLPLNQAQSMTIGGAD